MMAAGRSRWWFFRNRITQETTKAWRFDRAALAPRQPQQLLIDIALQLKAWFPEIEGPLRDLRAQMRDGIDKLARDESQRRREERTRSELKTCCRNLRKIVEEFNQSQAPVIISGQH